MTKLVVIESEELDARIQSAVERAQPSPYYRQDTAPMRRARFIALIKAQSIPGFKDGRDYFAKREDVHRYLEANPVGKKRRRRGKKFARTAEDIVNG